MAADRRLLAAAFAAIAFLTAGPARGAVGRPTQTAPASGALVQFLPAFARTAVAGADKYATSYSSNTTYPADTILYWRVRADDENLTGLTWSLTGTFQKKLAAPVPSASNPPRGDMLPVWAWSPVQGASAYDISIDQPDGTHRDFKGFRTPATSFIKMTGTGVWHWRVRRLTVSGVARRRHLSRIRAIVVDGRGRRLSSVKVRVTDAGLRRPVVRRTNVVGQVLFKLRSRKRGKLIFSASKAGFQPAYKSLRVRR